MSVEFEGFDTRGPAMQEVALDTCAELILDLRQRRAAELGADLFSDPAWEILLVLARKAATAGAPLDKIASDIGRSNECVGRWIKILLDRGHIETCGSDKICLTTSARDALSRITMSGVQP